MQNTTVAAVFEEYQRATAVIDRLVEGGVDVEAISLVMSDREADRHFTASARMRLGVPLPLSPAAISVAAKLAPLAALGTRGTGLVASGPLVASLVSAGVGAGGGLRKGLTQMGVDREGADQVAAKIRNGGLLVAVQASEMPEEERKGIAEALSEGSVLQMQLQTRVVTDKPTLRPLTQEDTPRGGIFPQLLRLVPEPAE